MFLFKIKYFFICILFLINITSASDFKLNLVYVEGESSKDSWSSTTTVTIGRNNLVYQKDYSGHVKEQKENKTGALTEEQIEKIAALIVNGKLNITDSLTDYTEKLNSNYSQYAIITLTIYLQGVSNTIKLEGDKKSLKEHPEYKSALDLIDLLKDYIDDL
jgi:hypothetical protein